MGGPSGRDHDCRVEKEEKRDGGDRLDTSRAQVLADQDGSEDEERGDRRGGGRVVKTIEGGAHDENPRNAEQLGSHAEREEEVDGQVRGMHQVQRPRKRAKTRQPIHEVTAAMIGTVKRVGWPRPTERQTRMSVAIAPTASSATSPSIGRRSEATTSSGPSAAMRTVAAMRKAFIQTGLSDARCGTRSCSRTLCSSGSTSITY